MLYTLFTVLIILSSLNYDRVVCKNNKSRLKISSHFKISNDGRRLKHSTIIPKNLIEEYETNPEIKKIFQSLNLNGRKNKQSSSSDASFTKSSKSSSKSSGESKYSDWKQERRQKSDDYQKLTAAGVKRKLTNGSIDGTRSNILRSKSIENQLPDKNPCITILSSDEDINRTLTASSVKNQSQTTQKVNNLQTSLEVIDLENYQPRAKSSSNRTIISSIYPSSSSSRSNSTSIYNFRKEQAESITKVGSNYTIFDDISKDWGTVNSRTNEVEDKEIHCIKVINEIDESVPEFFMYEKGTKIKG